MEAETHEAIEIEGVIRRDSGEGFTEEEAVAMIDALIEWLAARELWFDGSHRLLDE